MIVRWMIRRDMPKVLQIEATEAGDTAWTEDDFLQVLKKSNCIGMVAEDDDEAVIGFVIYELHSRKVVVINIAAESEDAFGVMIAKLKTKVDGTRRTRLYIDSHDSKLHQHLLLKEAGLRAVSVCGDEHVFVYRFEKDGAFV